MASLYNTTYLEQNHYNISHLSIFMERELNLSLSLFSQTQTKERELEPLEISGVIEDVIDVFNPTIRMSVSYSSQIVHNGVELYPSSLVNKPRVEIPDGDLRSFFTLVYCTNSLTSYHELLTR